MYSIRGMNATIALAALNTTGHADDRSSYPVVNEINRAPDSPGALIPTPTIHQDSIALAPGSKYALYALIKLSAAHRVLVRGLCSSLPCAVEKRTVAAQNQRKISGRAHFIGSVVWYIRSVWFYFKRQR